MWLLPFGPGLVTLTIRPPNLPSRIMREIGGLNKLFQLLLPMKTEWVSASVCWIAAQHCDAPVFAVELQLFKRLFHCWAVNMSFAISIETDRFH